MAVANKEKLPDLHKDHPAKQVAKMFSKMLVFQAHNERILLVDGARIFIPLTARQETLKELHTFYASISTMQASAALNVYWRGMAQHITDYVAQCLTCSIYHRHHLPPLPMVAHELAVVKPMDQLMCD